MNCQIYNIKISGSKSVVFLCMFYVFHISNSFAQVFDSTIILDESVVYFASDSHVVDNQNKVTISEFVRKHQNGIFILNGHTDGDGSDLYNMTLSENRVLAVQSFLRDSLHVNEVSIKINFYGKRLPVADNSLESGKMLNRRVVIDVAGNRKFIRIRGIVQSNTELPIDKIKIFAESKDFEAIAVGNKDGSFVIDVPYNLFVKLTATAADHFFDSKFIKADISVVDNHPVMKVTRMEKDRSYIIPDLFFVGNKAILLKKSENVLHSLTRTMQESDVCVIIEGHVNAPNQELMPPATFEYDLAFRRAKAITDHLISKGVNPSRLNPIGYSNWYMENPDPVTSEEMELNRRVELNIKDCDSLFKFSQENAVMPPNKTTKGRLHQIK